MKQNSPVNLSGSLGRFFLSERASIRETVLSVIDEVKGYLKIQKY